MPIYLVSPGNRLIRANTYGQAVNYAAKAMFKATPIKADDLADMLRAGAKIEDARAPVNQELPLEESDKPTNGNPGSHTGLSTSSSGGDSPAAVPSMPSMPFTGDNDVGVYATLPATGGPLEPLITDERRAELDRGYTQTFPADDIDTVNLEGIDHVQ